MMEQMHAHTVYNDWCPECNNSTTSGALTLMPNGTLMDWGTYFRFCLRCKNPIAWRNMSNPPVTYLISLWYILAEEP